MDKDNILNQFIKDSHDKFEKVATQNIIKATQWMVVALVLLFLSIGTGGLIMKYQIAINMYVYYSVVAALIALIGILVSLYRFHIKETAKFNWLQSGLLRIKLAIIISKGDAFLIQEIIKSLGDCSFNDHIKRKKNIESPIPGHFASDGLIELMKTINESIKKLSAHIPKEPH